MATAAAETRQAAIAALLQTADSLDERQFEQIYRHYHVQLCRFAISRGAIDPEGVVNMALFDAYRAFGRQPIRHEPAFRRYLYQAVTNRVIGEHRRRRPTPQEVPDHALVADDWSDELVDRQWLADGVDELPDAQKAVIQDRFYADLTVSESAERLGRNNGAVHQLQHRAVRRLRRILIGGAAVAVVVAAVALWRSSVDDRSMIDTGPAEAPAPDPGPTETLPPVGAAVVGETPPEGATGLEAGGADSAPTPTTLAAAETDADVSPDGVDPDPADRGPTDQDPSVPGSTGPADPADGADTAGSKPVTTPSTADDTNGQDPPDDGPAPSTTTTTKSPTTEPKPPSPAGRAPVDSRIPVDEAIGRIAEPATTANTCRYWFDVKGSFWLTLFDPEGDAGSAAAYRPPVKARVTDDAGVTVIVDISTTAATGPTSPRRTGWVALDELGVPQANFSAGSEDVWTAKFWDFPIDNVATAQFLHRLDNGEAIWAKAPACSGGHVLG